MRRGTTILLIGLLVILFVQPALGQATGTPDIRVDPLYLTYTINRDTASDDEVAMANPAATYCRKLGYDYTTLTGDKGEQRGVCQLPEQTCDAWDFINGTCGQASNVCARQGWETLVLSDGGHPFGETWAQCLDPVTGMRTTATDLIYVGATKTTRPDSLIPVDDSANVPASLTALPTSFDWRSYDGGDWTTPIRDQGWCGSCWSFSAAGVAEAVTNIANDDPNLDWDLAEQYLVADCCTTCGDCAGGSKASGLHFIINQGIPDEACLPYGDGDNPGGCTITDEGACDAATCTYCTTDECSDYRCGDACADVDDRLLHIESYDALGSDATTAEIKQALLDYGPLAASLLMDGTFTDDIYHCATNEDTNHAVIIVGYNDADGGYWIIKNSWGTGWEDSGYFNVGYDTCSIANWVYSADTDALDYDVEIHNDGDDTLTISGVSAVGDACWLDLAMPYGGLPANVAPGGLTGFDVDVDVDCVATDGVYTETIAIASNDPDDNPVNVAVQLTVTGGEPDLRIIASDMLPTTLAAGAPITWTGTIENNGGAPAGTSTVALSIGPNCNNADTLLDSAGVPALVATDSSETRLYFMLESKDTGTMAFVALADVDDVVAESNEANNKDCLEREVLPCSTLTTAANPTAGGSVTVQTPPACDTGTPGWADGSVVTLTVAVAEGYSFTGWSGDATGSDNPLAFTLNGDSDITANFNPQATCYTLTVGADPALAGTVLVDPLPNCNVDQYAPDTVVTLSAVSEDGYAFTGWTGDLTGDGNPETLTMNVDHSVTAQFEVATTCYALDVDVEPVASGSVAVIPLANCGSDYTAGTVVTLTASPAMDYVFSTWDGDLATGNNPATLSMNAPRAVTARFVKDYTFTVMLPVVLK